MTKTLIALAALVVASQSALAETFTRGGSTYNYSVEQHGKAKLITGKILDTNEPFRLRVSGTHVTGSVNGRWVTFSTRDVISSTASAKSAEIAAR